MQKTFLQKVIIISFFISMTILLDVFWIFTMNKIFINLYFVKLSLIVIFLAGFLLGFRNVFIICLFYTVWHIIRSFSSFFIFTKSFNLTDIEIFFSIFLDYIFPDLIISISGFCFLKKRNTINKKKIFFILFLICFLRMCCFCISSYFIYGPKITAFSKNILIYSLIYNLNLFLQNLIFNIICFLILIPKIENLLQ